MKIKKTMGTVVSGKDRKGYMIHTECGERFLAEPVGSQRYSCNGLTFKSLRAVKDSIIKGALAESDDEEATEESTTSGLGTFECVHPCAWIVKHLLVTMISDGVIDTLDKYGWLDCAGRPDIARAEREIARVKKLSEKS